MTGRIRTALALASLLLGGCSTAAEPAPSPSAPVPLSASVPPSPSKRAAAPPSPVPATFRPGELRTVPDPRKLLSRGLLEDLRFAEDDSSECEEHQPNDLIDAWGCYLLTPSAAPSDGDLTTIFTALHRPFDTQSATAFAKQEFAELPDRRTDSSSWTEASLGDEAMRSRENAAYRDDSTVVFRVKNVTVMVSVNIDEDRESDDSARYDAQQQRAWRVASDLARSLVRLSR
ncbi:hypothetical protein [Actinocorallia libanotica]|uniref:PknH-like protein n=1 Tax=Actinocorallia libanotica TaxID=46162 RepID=A0ABP4AW72_9ACTN